VDAGVIENYATISSLPFAGKPDRKHYLAACHLKVKQLIEYSRGAVKNNEPQEIEKILR